MSDQKKIYPKLKLNDNHVTMKKFLKLTDLAEDLGISLEFLGDRICITDINRDPKLPPIYIEDIEGGSIEEFPINMEYKMTYDNPEYLEQERLKKEELSNQRKERERLEELKKTEKLALQKKAELEREEKRLKDEEIKEKALLADLKAKWEGT
jgi:hypothetical protein